MESGQLEEARIDQNPVKSLWPQQPHSQPPDSSDVAARYLQYDLGAGWNLYVCFLGTPRLDSSPAGVRWGKDTSSIFIYWKHELSHRPRLTGLLSRMNGFFVNYQFTDSYLHRKQIYIFSHSGKLQKDVLNT